MKSRSTRPATAQNIRRMVVALAATLALLGTVLLTGPAPDAAAASITVNSDLDVVSSVDGRCTLREAITAANTGAASGGVAGECAAGSGTDTINFLSGYTIVLGGTNLPVVQNTLVINGSGSVTVDGNGASSIFFTSTADLTLGGLTITGANAATEGSAVSANFGSTVSIIETIVDNNAGESVVYAKIGGTLIIQQSRISRNTTDRGAVWGATADTSITATDSDFLDNTGTDSAQAGALNSAGTVNLVRTVFEGNTNNGTSSAAAVMSQASGNLNVLDSSIDGNTAAGLNGSAVTALGNVGVINQSGVTNNTTGGPAVVTNNSSNGLIRNSTVSGNTNGGVLAIDSLKFEHATIANNAGDAAVILTTGANVTSEASILNGAGGFKTVRASGSWSGTWATLGANVYHGISDVPFSIADDFGDPLVLPLALNGGSSLNHALANLSPAIDNVSAPIGFTVDQRGSLRPKGIFPDSGAFEADALICLGAIVTRNMNNGTSGVGTAGDDVILGTPAGDSIAGSGGNDKICAGGGDDTVNAGPGDDEVRGGAGADTINGNDGIDNIAGGGGGDIINGGAGNDVIRGQAGTDNINGGDNDDEIDGQGAADIINGGSGDDTINGQNGADTMNGGPGNDVIKGQTGPDTFFGEAGDDSFTGGNGNDTMSGGSGVDRCAGNLGTGDSAEAATCEKTPGVEIFF